MIMMRFLGPTFIEAGQTKVLTYKPTDIDVPFRPGQLTVPRHLEGLDGLFLERVEMKEKGVDKPLDFPSNHIPMSCFIDQALGVSLGLLPEVRYGDEMSFHVKNESSKGCPFDAVLVHVPPEDAAARLDAMRAADERAVARIEGGASPQSRKILEIRETVIGIGPTVIPAAWKEGEPVLQGCATVPGQPRGTYESLIQPYQRKPDELLWTVGSHQNGHLEKWDEFIPERLIVPSSVAGDFNILDVNFGGRGQRAMEAYLAWVAQKDQRGLQDGRSIIHGIPDIEPFPARWVDEDASVRNENLGIKMPLRFVMKLKRGARVSMDIQNTSKEMKTFSACIIGKGVFYEDNLI